MNLLVNCGHDINEKKTIFGVSPLHTAIEFYHKNKDSRPLDYIIECNANINAYDSNGWTGLHHASKNGDLEVCKLLIENNYNRADTNLVSNKVNLINFSIILIFIFVEINNLFFI